VRQAVTIGEEERLDRMRSVDLPQAGASFLLGMFAASRNGEFNVVNPGFGELLGGSPPCPARELG